VDEIILVGFSRGGFTVRCLAAFIDEVGLLRRRGLPFLDTLFSLWRLQGSGDNKKELEQIIKLLDVNEFLARRPKIKVLAEWDTVSAMGIRHMKTPEFAFVNYKVPECVESAFHAIAIHERRYKFAPMPYYKARPDTNVRQCLFAGCHFDIGGGNEDAGLSMLPFLLMVDSISSASSAKFDNVVMFGYRMPLAVESRLRFDFKLRRVRDSSYITCSESFGKLHQLA
jgi:uncharacterized protein (DUF2235 family)